MARVDVVPGDRQQSTSRSDDDAVARRSPRHRPPIAVRAFVALIALGACVFAAALMISDRAPALLVDVFGDTARQLWDRIDVGQRARLATDASLPEKDFVVHVAVWGVVTCLVALAIWTWTGLVATVFAVFGLSVVIELAQGRLSSTRSVDPVDVVANGIGVALGATAAAVAFAGWSLVASAVDTSRRHDRTTAD